MFNTKIKNKMKYPAKNSKSITPHTFCVALCRFCQITRPSQKKQTNSTLLFHVGRHSHKTNSTSMSRTTCLVAQKRVQSFARQYTYFSLVVLLNNAAINTGCKNFFLSPPTTKKLSTNKKAPAFASAFL